MKSRKTIRHAELVAEVMTATKSRGVLDPADIKKNIEKYTPFLLSSSRCIFRALC